MDGGEYKFVGLGVCVDMLRECHIESIVVQACCHRFKFAAGCQFSGTVLLELVY